MKKEIADSFYLNGEYDKAIECFDALINENPQDSEAFEGRGLCHFALLNVQPAIHDLTQGISLDPKNHNAFYNRGLIYSEKNKLSLAQADIKTAIQIYGESVEYYSSYMYVSLLSKDYKEALTYTKGLLEFNPDDF